MFESNQSWYGVKQVKLEENIKVEAEKHPRKLITHGYKSLRNSKDQQVTGFRLNPVDGEPTFSAVFDGLPPMFHVQRCAMSGQYFLKRYRGVATAEPMNARRMDEQAVGPTDRRSDRRTGGTDGQGGQWADGPTDRVGPTDRGGTLLLKVRNF